MVRSTHLLACTLSLTFLPLVCLTVFGQTKSSKKGEPIQGTVVSIDKEKTGKNYRMKIKNSDNDEELDVPLVPRTQFYVTAKGDEGFLKVGAFVQTRVVQSGEKNEFFAKDFTVIVGGNPVPYIKPDETDKTVFDVAGKIADMDKMEFLLQATEQVKIQFESEKEVTVKISDPLLIKVGDAVEVEGTVVKAKKQINAHTVNVASTTDINSDEYFTAVEERKKTKTSTKTKTTKSKTDIKGDGDAGNSSDNPFKSVKKKKTTKTEGPVPTISDPFKDVKKKDTKKDEKPADDTKKDDSKEKDSTEKTDKPA